MMERHETKSRSILYVNMKRCQGWKLMFIMSAVNLKQTHGSEILTILKSSKVTYNTY